MRLLQTDWEKANFGQYLVQAYDITEKQIADKLRLDKATTDYNDVSAIIEAGVELKDVGPRGVRIENPTAMLASEIQNLEEFFIFTKIIIIRRNVEICC